MRRRITLKRLVAVMAAALAFGAATASPAPAVDLGPLQVDIFVNTGDWSACGVVRDTLTSARYTAVLTATGYESTVSRNGVILGEASASGNPATPCTAGGFDSSIAVVEYTLTWTSILGTTGTMTKTCVEVPPSSTDVEIHIDPPPIEASSGSAIVPPTTTLARPYCTIT